MINNNQDVCVRLKHIEDKGFKTFAGDSEEFDEFQFSNEVYYFEGIRVNLTLENIKKINNKKG